MHTSPAPTWIAFGQARRIAAGAPRAVTGDVKAYVEAHPSSQVLIFDATTSAQVEIDLRGALSTVLRRVPAPAKPDAQAPEPAPPAGRTPGRPRLGVVAREVTLLPRHWEWLASQPGGASVVLRKLVEQARRASTEADRVRAAQESAYRFMTTMAGNLPGYEEAIRALFAGDLARLPTLVGKWPRDVRNHALSLAAAVSPADPPQQGTPAGEAVA